MKRKLSSDVVEADKNLITLSKSSQRLNVLNTSNSGNIKNQQVNFFGHI